MLREQLPAVREALPDDWRLYAGTGMNLLGWAPAASRAEDVEAYEYEDESRTISECVHIYCQAADCGWMHRGLMRDGEMVRNA